MNRTWQLHIHGQSKPKLVNAPTENHARAIAVKKQWVITAMGPCAKLLPNDEVDTVWRATDPMSPYEISQSVTPAPIEIELMLTKLATIRQLTDSGKITAYHRSVINTLAREALSWCPPVRLP